MTFIEDIKNQTLEERIKYLEQAVEFILATLLEARLIEKQGNVNGTNLENNDS